MEFNRHCCIRYKWAAFPFSVSTNTNVISWFIGVITRFIILKKYRSGNRCNEIQDNRISNYNRMNNNELINNK